MNIEECQKKMEMLERRASRERVSRKLAEQLLEQRSSELYASNQDLVKANVELEKLIVAIDQSPTIVVITDRNGEIEYVNSSFNKVTGYKSREVLGKNIKSITLTSNKEIADAIEKSMLNNQIWQGQLSSKSKNNEDLIFSVTITPIFDEEGEVTSYLYGSENITEKKLNEEKIYHLAHYDTLTGLYNRFSLESRLEQMVFQANRTLYKIAVLFIDLDRFKAINDSLGHKAGDELLKQVSMRLKGVCGRDSDVVARIGGDEFVIVLNNISDITFAALTAQVIVEVLSQPFHYENHELLTSPSVGISIYPDDANKCLDLIKAADAAMYFVKERGKKNFSFYTKEMNLQIQERIKLEIDLREALKNNDFELYYQPQCCVLTSKICGVESLIRWNHKDLGFISPEKFIGIAEEMGLIYELGLWILETAFDQLNDWQSMGFDSLHVAINISAKQLENENFIKDVQGIVSRTSVNTSKIELEVTESVAMNNPEKSIQILEELRNLGFEIAIDDFGTGYSSLSYLKLLPIETLKIDRAFVHKLESDKNNSAICKATISLSHDLGLKVVAEGVETVGQLNYLKENLCDKIQGYYISRPIPAQALTEFLNKS